VLQISLYQGIGLQKWDKMNLLKTVILMVVFFTINISLGQNVTPAPAPTNPTKLVKLKTPDTEVGDAILFLEKLPVEERRFVKFLTTFGIKDVEARKREALVCSFLVHSMIGAVNEEFNAGAFYPIAHMEDRSNPPDGVNETFVADHLVPGSDTLWWIDIREYNWTEQAWENVAKEEGYFVEPIVTHEKNGALRLYSGNAVVRMDWFNTHASSVTQQADVDSKIRIYRELTYASVKTGPPKTVKDFEKIWLIDTDKARKLGNAFSALVTKSQNVALHNRILFGYRTELGWYYRTYDVKNLRGIRDYAENILDFKGNPPPKFDAGEIFATNQLHLQVYDLYNDKENIIDFGDPSVVRHTSDVLSDVRVRSAHSCFDCHAAGPIPSENSLLEFLKARGEANVYDYRDKLRVERTLLNGEFEDSIKDNQVIFARSLSKANGLKPEENVKYYLDSVSNYGKSLDLERVAFECGMTPEIFKENVKENKNPYNKLPLRVGLLLSNKETIPRASWESPGADGQPGTFQQTMISIYGLTKITDSYLPPNQAVIQDQVVQFTKVVAIANGQIMSGPTPVASYKAGDEFKHNGKVITGWVGVETIDGKVGYIQQANVKFK